MIFAPRRVSARAVFRPTRALLRNDHVLRTTERPLALKFVNRFAVPRVVLPVVSLLILFANAVWLLAPVSAFAGSKIASETPRPAAPTDADKRYKLSVERLVASEELILKLTPDLIRMTQSIMNLRLPDHHSRSVFGSKVRVRDLETGVERSERILISSWHFEARDWPIADSAHDSTARGIDLWRPFLDRVQYFEHAEFHFIDGALSEEVPRRFHARIGFSALARMSGGEWISVTATLDSQWTKASRLARAMLQTRAWRLTELASTQFSTLAAPRQLFSSTAPEALSDARLLARAQGSAHERYLVDMVRLGEKFDPPHPYFLIKPTDWQPGVSVVDIDRDGLDDLYVMDRWGKNWLLRNRGDGTFEDIAPKLGLDVKDHSSSAIFADFDNDGDTDLFLGRTLEPSQYWVNESGHFVERSEEWVSTSLPSLVTSVSAVDYDGDGLLDVYFSTYAAELMAVQLAELDDSASATFLGQFLPAAQARRLSRLYRASHKYLGRAGPPNVLLRNTGSGRFELAPQNAQLEVWRNTFQSTWADFDGDGDVDLYVANDFSGNNMFRNDAGSFTDVTAETGTADIGFGMGASWGDYDNDGALDLYVSNMYSKAGRRITQQVPGLDPRLADMSRGNSLFRNRGRRFEKVSGLEPPALAVERAGWSWGGQFVDVDNDGFLDVYAASGMFTAPKEFAIPGADL